MAATNWTAIFRETKEGIITLTNYKNKMTYKTALAVARESMDDNPNFDLVCVVETNKIMLENDKEEEKKIDI